MDISSGSRAVGLQAMAGSGIALDPAPLVGSWSNTNPEGRGFVRLDVESRGGELRVRTFGAGSPQPVDWGQIAAAAFAKEPAARTATAFSAFYDLGFLRAHLQANVKQGVLVVASFNEFRDGSGRSSYFTREFFFR